MALSPTSSRGSTFNGGTITTPLNIALSTIDAPFSAQTSDAFGLSTDSLGALTVITDSAQASLEVEGQATSFTVGDAFGVRLRKMNAAPADAALAAGDVALWFDQTNGAAATKLMVKGKSADGTVKTAAIVLT